MATAQYDSLLAELPSLTKFAYFLTGDPQIAEDLVQDSLVRAIASAHQKDDKTSLRAWLFAILRNRHIDLRRRQHKRPDAETLDGKEWALPAPDQHAASSFLHDLGRSFAKLPADLREIMWLVGVEGLSYDEAAEVIGIPTGTVRSRMFRARELLKTEMQDYWTPPEAEVRADA